MNELDFPVLDGLLTEFLEQRWAANCRNTVRERVAGAGKVFGHNHIEDSLGMVGQMELFA